MITMSCTCQGLSHPHMHSDTPLENPSQGGYNIVIPDSDHLPSAIPNPVASSAFLSLGRGSNRLKHMYDRNKCSS